MSLKDQLTADLPTFLSTSEFADQATVTPLDGTPVTFECIFDDAFEAISMVTGAVEQTSPRAACRTSDTTELRQDGWVTINAVAYRIVGIEPDGTGVTVLRLSKDKA